MWPSFLDISLLISIYTHKAATYVVLGGTDKEVAFYLIFLPTQSKTYYD